MAGRKRLRLEELSEEHFVDFPAGSAGREQSDHAFRDAGVTRDVTIEAMEIDLILGMIRHDLAMALLPPRVIPADECLATGGVIGS